MSKKETKKLSPKEAREQRLRAQLRSNLQRRKGQARARVEQSEDAAPKDEQSEG